MPTIWNVLFFSLEGKQYVMQEECVHVNLYLWMVNNSNISGNNSNTSGTDINLDKVHYEIRRIMFSQNEWLCFFRITQFPFEYLENQKW